MDEHRAQQANPRLAPPPAQARGGGLQRFRLMCPGECGEGRHTTNYGRLILENAHEGVCSW
jgi:hypothetical protein